MNHSVSINKVRVITADGHKTCSSLLALLIFTCVPFLVNAQDRGDQEVATNSPISPAGMGRSASALVMANTSGRSVSLIQDPLYNGTFTVGLAGTYTTLTAAVAAYNGAVLDGAVVFELLDATYPAETFPIIINANAGASAVNTLTIRPKPGVAATITGSSTLSIIKLNGADYVTIDGVNSGGSSLTIKNTNTGLTSAIIWIGSAGAGNGATNNKITKCTLTGNTSTTTFAGIISSSGAAVGGAAEAANANNTYSNNTVNTSLYGISLVGPAGSEPGNVISGNQVGSVIASNKIGAIGIAIQQQTGVTVTGNTVAGVLSASSATATGIDVQGAISGGTISGNFISDIRNTDPAGWGSNGIYLASSTVAAGLNVFNNAIYEVRSEGFAGVTSSDNGYGMIIEGGGGYNIRFNSIRLDTNQTDVTGITAAINITSSITGTVDIRDNIFSNTQTIGNRYAIYSDAANTVYSNINYNDYFSLGILGFLAANQATIANWRTATAQDANSVSVNPLFTSTNLALTGLSPLIGAGVTIAGITTDITNSTRNNPPSIGAYEQKIVFSAKIWLSGAYSTALSRHKNVTTAWYNVLSTLALTQPYGTLTNNFGPTTVLATAFTNNTDPNGPASDVIDWVLVDLRDATTPNTIIAQRAAFVREDGLVVDVDGFSPVSFKGLSSANYFIDIRHRNHLSVRTAATQTVNGNAAAPAAYDFTTALASARDSAANLLNRAMKDVSLLANGTAWGLWGGNGNGNNSPVAAGFKTVRASGGANVLVNDYTYLINFGLSGNAATPVTNVYHNADYNMDGTIRATGSANPLINDYTFLVNYILGGTASLIITQHQ